MKAPSISISAPSGTELIAKCAPTEPGDAGVGLPAGVVAAAGCSLAPVAGSADTGEVAEAAVGLCSAQWRAMPRHASSTDPPSERVDLLTMESPLWASNTATLFLWRRAPLPPS